MSEWSQSTNANGYYVSLTPRAAQVVHEAFAEHGDTDKAYLRVGARAGGCSGFMYNLDYASSEEIGVEDVVFQSQGIHVAVNADCLNNVLGSTEIDYQDGNLVEQGFRFERKTDGAVCGCGESFTPLKPTR